MDGGGWGGSAEECESVGIGALPMKRGSRRVFGNVVWILSLIGAGWVLYREKTRNLWRLGRSRIMGTVVEASVPHDHLKTCQESLNRPEFSRTIEADDVWLGSWRIGG